MFMQSNQDIQQLNATIQQQSAFVQTLFAELNKQIIGQQYMLERLLIGLLANGHVLLEGVPGLAKTLAIKTLAKSIGGAFSRIQFTPDLLPADVVGTMIYNAPQNKFEVKKGPIFANFILADEINRAPAKVQSALLEAMQEKQITLGDTTFALQEPFLVLATQNPVEQEGTYTLPEAQVDRFMLKVVITYPTMAEEKLIIRQQVNGANTTINQVVQLQQILDARQLVQQIYVDEKIEQYILDIVFATREPAKYQLQKLQPYITYGASPRASIALALASKAHAFIQQRGYVIPEDVRAIAMDVMRHRIGLSYEAEAENITAENIVTQILNKVVVP
jgi:MoxR-like ATPase